MDTAVWDEQTVNHVTDLQHSQAVDADGDELCDENGDPDTALTSEAAAASEAASPDAAASSNDAQSATTTTTGLATPAAKRRRYRSLFGNIGKLITFNRRKQGQPASPSATGEPSEPQQFPPADPVSLDLIVPDQEASSVAPAEEDQISGYEAELETQEPQHEDSLAAASEAAAAGGASDTAEEPSEEQGSAEQQAEPGELQDQTAHLTAEEKQKMEYDMGMGGISTIMEETDEAVKAQEVGLLTEADLIRLESEIDLADFDSQRLIPKASQAKGEKASPPKAALHNQLSESDSGYGYSTSDSPVEADVEKPEKPHPAHAEEDGSNGGSNVFAKEVEDLGKTHPRVKPALKGDHLISPSDEELASFEKAEVCVEDSMVDLGDINVKLDSLIESNSPDKLSRTDDELPLVMKPSAFVRASESLEEEEDEGMEPVELDLSSNQSVRRRKLMEAKARRQLELEAARKQQEEALAGPGPTEDRRTVPGPPGSPAVRDKDIVDGLGPRRHSHENNACSAEGSDGGGRSRMRSRLPVRRSASCPRRTVEDYSTYIRSGSAARKQPISHLIESSYSPVKIDFRPLSRAHAQPETHGEQLTAPQQQPQQQQQQQQQQPPQQGQAIAVGQAGKRGASKKVHFNSPTVDQVVTYAPAAIDSEDNSMKQQQQRESEENGQHPGNRAKPPSPGLAGTGARTARLKPGEAEKLPAGQNDRSLLKSISVKQTLASRKRLEKLHEDAVKQLGLQDESQYMTPLQRKDLEMKELKRQLDEAYFVIEQRELELDVFHHGKTKSIDDAVKDREERIAGLQVQISQLDRDFSSLRAQHSEICKREKGLAETLDQLRTECAERERRHQDLYLEMYRKGRDSAKFERQDEIEKLAVLEPDKVAMEELLEKLEITQHDLQKWQSIKLKEVYEDSDKTATEADAKLRFLRDSMFHYLTEKDREQNQQHLMAMIGIFSFTDVQMKHIMKALDDRRKKGKI